MNEEYIHTIHRYLNGDMDASEQAAFEARLPEDPELREALDLERLLLAGIHRAGQQQLRQTVGAVHQALAGEQFFEINRPKPVFLGLSTPRWLAAAAALAVLATAVWFFALRQPIADQQALFAQHYQPETDRAQQVIESLTSYGLAGVATETDSLKAALERYRAGQSDAALRQLRQFADNHPENHTAAYYLGVIYLERGNYPAAAAAFQPLAQAADSGLQNDARWNLALCFLKIENQPNGAIDLLKTLAADPANPYYRQAQNLLQQLSK